MNTGIVTYRSGYYSSLWQNIGSSEDIIDKGSIILYKTGNGLYGKLKIIGYAYDYAWSNAVGQMFCDVPIILFTTFNEDGSVYKSSGHPDIPEQSVRFYNDRPLQGVMNLSGPIPLGTEAKYWDYPERPDNASFMWFYFDLDTNQTAFYNSSEGWIFDGADLYNRKTATTSKLYARNGAKFLVVYKP
jgi:hypothetical protein